VRVDGAGLNGRANDRGSDGQAGCTGSDERYRVSRAGGRAGRAGGHRGENAPVSVGRLDR
jgi:hypothetical protein